MLLYVKVEAERGGRVASKGDNESVRMEVSAFGKILGEIELHVMTDAEEKNNQYLLTYRPYEDGEYDEDIDPIIIEEGHRNEGVIQRARG